MTGDSVNTTPTSASGNGEGRRNSPPEERISILMAASPEHIAPLTTVFRADARFSLAATATSGDDVRAKLAVKPAVVLAHAQVFDSFDAFAAGAGPLRGQPLRDPAR